MPSLRWISLPLILGLALPPVGCGLLRRRGNTTTNVSSSVEVNQQGRDIATLQRDQYEVIGTSMGKDRSSLVYILTIPVGSQTSSSEGVANAYYEAVDSDPECDSLLMPRVETKRTIIPLLLVNIVIRRTHVKGRCVHIADDAPRAGEAADAPDAPDDDGEAGSDTGGGGEPVASPPDEAPEAS
jgi:hypothetical protein